MEFSRAHLTVILLLYGGSLLALAAMSWRLRRSEHALAMPWDWLARFAMLHGVSQWLAIPPLYEIDTPACLLARLATLGCSFLCLLEFARRSLSPRNDDTLAGAWIAPLVLILVALGLWSKNIAWMEAPCRLLFGFPSSAFASLMLWGAAKASHDCRGLHLATAALFLHGLAAGAIVPASTWAPSWASQTAFADIFGFPVDLLRTLCAILLTIGVGWHTHKLSLSARTSPPACT